jgi:conjugative transfer signal peptidase TraF
MPKRLFWNASGSVPIGLYIATKGDQLARGDIVVFDPPPAIARFADARRYLPLGTPMLKRVAGLPGDRVCREGRTVRIGRIVVFARDEDRSGRALPTWNGCRLVGPGQVFLLNADVPDSLDGRYFGPQPAERVMAVVAPIWLPGRDA